MKINYKSCDTTLTEQKTKQNVVTAGLCNLYAPAPRTQRVQRTTKYTINNCVEVFHLRFWSSKQR
jgi:hypothetical protein